MSKTTKVQHIQAWSLAAAWVLTSDYPLGAIVEKDDKFYEANAVIPASTTFATGTSGATWKEISASDALDGNHVTITRANNTTGVEPTIGEVATPILGDTVHLILQNNTQEFWGHDGTAWVLVKTIGQRVSGRVAVTGVLSQVVADTNITATSPVIVLYEDAGDLIPVYVTARVADTSFTVTFADVPPTTGFINYQIG
jgi:hypothetical protein